MIKIFNKIKSILFDRIDSENTSCTKCIYDECETSLYCNCWCHK